MNSHGSVTIMSLLCLLFFTAGTVRADDYIDAVERGNEAMGQGDYKTALEQYHIAETDIPESPELAYNIAGALSAQGSYEEAVEYYNRAMETTDMMQEFSVRANLGNNFFYMEDYPKAIESYETALEIDPTDVEVKYNLELARKMLKENSESQEGGQEQQQQQKQEEQEQPPGGEQQQQGDEGEKSDGDKEPPPEGDPGDQPPEDDPEEGPPQQGGGQDEMSKEEAERILNALKDDEQEIQKQLRRKKQPGTYNGKDW